MVLSQLVMGVYVCLLGFFALLGVHRVWLIWRSRLNEVAECVDDMLEWPGVTLQLPLYNERFVAARLIRAVAKMDYPREKIQIQVLDDSTDQTRSVVDEVARELLNEGFDIQLVRRSGRAGYKAGALSVGLMTAKYRFIAVFDADFVPAASFLKRTIRAFSPTVGMVQARWGHLNASDSWLTRAQAAFLDGHFSVEHAARYQTQRWFNFNGTAGVWRKQAICDAGGWSADTVTEDLDLSYRAQLAGWKFVYLNDVVAPAELPGTMSAFKVQQYRWAKGAVQTARKLLLSIWRAPQSFPVKLEATIHLTGNIAYPLMVLLALLLPLTIHARMNLGIDDLFIIDLVLFMMTTASVGLYYYVAGRKTGGSVREQLLRVPISLALGIGMSLSQTLAVVAGLSCEGGVFDRTPKSGDSKEIPYHSVPKMNGVPELIMAGYLLSGLVLSLGSVDSWPSAPFLSLFAAGYAYVGLNGLWGRGGGRFALPKRVQPQLGSK